MSTHFSIGEISRLHNLSIQTLRYYDKIGLLKPAYINKETNYRYYTIEQFVKIDGFGEEKCLEKIEILIE